MFRQSETQVAQKSPRKPRWGRRGLALLLSVSLLISVFCVSVSAATSYNCPVSRPQLTGNNFYAEVITANDWHMLIIGQVSTTGISLHDISFTAGSDGNTLWFNANIPLEASSSSNVYFSGVYIDMKYGSSGSLGHKNFNQCFISLHNSGKVTGIHGYNLDVTSLSVLDNDFIINYGSDSLAMAKLDAILAALNNSSSSTETAVDNANKKAEEREKQETQTSGDNATNDTTNAMPSVDSGFANSLKSFVGSMSYNGTEAILPIPKTSIPAIAGVTDEVVLIPEQGYDLSTVIKQYIPANLLTLLQHFFDIALVLYCVYELYGLIQYVLTLKKGGKEE